LRTQRTPAQYSHGRQIFDAARSTTDKDQLMTRDEHFACGPPGWLPLLHELDTKLKERWPDYTILQVKEKFGTLRFYADAGLAAPDFPDSVAGQIASTQWHVDNIETFRDVICEYETRSAEICERCGGPGKLDTTGMWWSTRCAACVR
jgi:hypothetical protein